jgi:esterase
MNLFYKTEGNGQPLIILHGLFGSADNWLTLAKRFGKYRKVYLLDQRNHGRSPHHPEFSYNAMMNDLRLFLTTHDIIKPDILGHSMGGKVAMGFAVRYPDLVNKLMVIDIAPKSYPIRHDVILEGLKAIDIEGVTKRQDADDELAEYVEDMGVRQFLLKNLKRSATGGYEWKMNLDVIYDQIGNVGEGLKPADKFSHKTLFVRGSLSSYILDEDLGEIKKHFPESSLVTIQGASHWVHAEKPAELSAVIEDFLLSK